jgi:putative MFS transporter
MSRIQITADGQTLMDATVGVRKGELPSLDELKTSLSNAAGGTMKPWTVCALQALALSLQPMLVGNTMGDTTITITTREQGWTLDVDSAIQGHH